MVAGTEPAALKKLGRSSNLPEKYGVDVLWSAHGELCGVQRKEVKDLLASVRDGRLGKELAQMKGLGFRALCIEGVAQWTTEGQMVKQYGEPWSREQWTGLLLTVQMRGCWVLESSSVPDTARVVAECIRWSEKTEHKSLLSRPGAVASWGTTPDDRDFAVHVLQGFPGIGPELAARIYDRFGRLPFTLSCTDEELRAVDGLGPKKIKQLRRVFG